MEGCKTILYSDCRQLALTLHDGQTHGYLWTGGLSLDLSKRSTDDDEVGETKCQISQEPIFPQLSGAPMPVVLPFGVSTMSSHSVVQHSDETVARSASSAATTPSTDKKPSQGVKPLPLAATSSWRQTSSTRTTGSTSSLQVRARWESKCDWRRI